MTRRHGYYLFGLYYVSRKVIPINTAGIETDGLLSPSRFGRRPVAEQHNLLAVINLVPGRTIAVGAIRALPTTTPPSLAVTTWSVR